MNQPPFSTPRTAPTGRLAAWEEEQRQAHRQTAAGQLEALRASCAEIRDAVLAALRVRR